jgi:hypothetical protein
VYDEKINGPVECGIVLTKKMVGAKAYNTLYKVTGFQSQQLTSTIVTCGTLGIENNVSIVSNYESDYVCNIYICDGLTPIKVINICDSKLSENGQVVEVNDPTRFDITPGCVLLPFVF